MNEMYLEHHGILGQRWGVRRYQNADGSLTSAGEKRYYGGSSTKKEARQHIRSDFRSAKKNARDIRNKQYSEADAKYNKATAKMRSQLESIDKEYDEKAKNISSAERTALNKIEKDMNSEKEDMDFFEEGYLYDEAYENYSALEQKYKETQKYYDDKRRTNDLLRLNSKEMVRDFYSDSTEKATYEKNEAYRKAGEQYTNSIFEAKQNKKNAKEELKRQA